MNTMSKNKRFNGIHKKSRLSYTKQAEYSVMNMDIDNLLLLLTFIEFETNIDINKYDEFTYGVDLLKEKISWN